MNDPFAGNGVWAVTAILNDLIIEIQNPDTGKKSDCQECNYVGACQMHYAEEVEHCADRAQARLEEMNNE